MSRPRGQRRYSQCEAGDGFKTVNIVKLSNPSGNLLKFFRIDSILQRFQFNSSQRFSY